MTTIQQTLSIATYPFADACVAASALARCTLYPWVITVHYCVPNGATECRIVVEQRTLADTPVPESFVPDGATFLQADVFPAMRFDDMRPDVRQRYSAQYRAYLMWRKARAIGKAELVPGVDFDPDAINASVVRWASGDAA